MFTEVYNKVYNLEQKVYNRVYNSEAKVYNIDMEIRKKILALAEKGPIGSRQVVEAFGISRQAAAGHLRKLVAQNQLIKYGRTNGSQYTLTSVAFEKYQKTVPNRNLEEHVVWEKIYESAHLLEELPDNIQSVLEYAFSEMLNNAIDHSQTKQINIQFERGQREIQFEIKDAGVGVFRNIVQSRKLQNEYEAIQDLMKGKLTTAPKAHSGEGIFFTSRVADRFVLESFGFRMTRDNQLDDVFVERFPDRTQGTRVRFMIDLESDTHLKDVFDRYTSADSDHGFDTTEVPMELYKFVELDKFGTVYVSRSQARRVLHGLEKFEHIIFDFKNVPTVGQAFADEIFRVWSQKHPHKVLSTRHTNETVDFMIQRAIKTQR